VSSFDDYDDEMARLNELSDRDLDRLFAGGSTGSALSDDLGAVLGAARTALTEAPSEVARERHLAVVLQEARDLALAEQSRAPAPVPAPVSPWRKVMRRSLSVALKLSVALGAATLSMAGLAYAGVDLPGNAAENAVENVLRIELPNQGRPENAGKSVADEVQAVIESFEDRGCEFGQAVAAAASANRQDESPAKDDPCTKDDSNGANGSRATAEERSAEGRARASEASGGASDAGADNVGTHDDFSRATAEEASNGGQGNGSSASEAGADNAGTHDDFGRATAEEASNGGQGNGSSASEAGADNAGTHDDFGRATAEGASSWGQEKAASASARRKANRPTD
jgi:hypothetical protein